jgi:hypothetical protein
MKGAQPTPDCPEPFGLLEVRPLVCRRKSVARRYLPIVNGRAPNEEERVELRCPVCRSERLVVILRTQLVLCKVCGWRWLEDDQWERLGLAAPATTGNSPPTSN